MDRNFMKTIKLILILCLIFVYSYSKATTYTLVSSGSILNPAHWAAVGTGTSPVDFTGVHTWSLDATTNTALTLSGAWAIDPTSTVVLTGGTGNTITLTYSGSASINNANLLMNNNAILVLNTPYNFTAAKTTYSTGSTVIYSTGTSSVATDNYYNLVCDANLSVNSATIVVTGSCIVNGSKNLLLVNSGILETQGDLITTNAAMGSDNTGTLKLYGSTGNVSITFSLAANQFANIFINKPNKFIEFKNSFVVSNTFSVSGTGYTTFASGCRAMLNGDVVFGSGHLFRSTSGATITIGGSGSITGSLSMQASFNVLDDLNLNRAATLPIGSYLIILNQVTVSTGTIQSNGNMQLVGYSEKNARVGTSTGKITGNVIVQTNIPGPSTGWALWGVAGVTGKTVSNWASQIPMACNGCPNSTTSIQGGFNSVQGWNEGTGTYDQTVGFSTSLVPGLGYWVYVGSGSVTTTAYRLITTGPIMQGAGTIPLTKTTSSYNLIANPYPSPISFTALRAVGANSSKIANAFYGWNADLGGGAGGFTQRVGSSSSPNNITGLQDVIPAG